MTAVNELTSQALKNLLSNQFTKNIGDLDDVDTMTMPPSANQVLTYDGTQWEPGSVPRSLNGLSDVDTSTTPPSNGNFLGYDPSGLWKPKTFPTIPSTLNDLSDVDTTGATSGQALVVQSDGTWKPGTVSGGSSAYKNIKDAPYNAVGDGVTDDTTAIQNAINNEVALFFPPGTYKITSTINVPQGKDIELHGAGFRLTKLQIAANITGFSYIRNSTSSGTTLNIRDMQFVESGLGKTSTAIKFFGYDVTKHDNWLRMENCSLYGFSRAVDLKFCGQCHFVGIYAQSNTTVYFLERDASFIYFDRCMNLSNASFIYADDTLADGISNGIFVDNCHSVTGSDVDIRIYGWQSVYIVGGSSCDLGTGGAAALYLNTCYDFSIDSAWFASNKTSAPSRYGIQLVNCHSGSISNSSIVNNGMGIRVDGSPSYATKLNIHGNKFDGNTTNDVFVSGNGKAIKITNNSFKSIPSRTGTNYEVYTNTTGTDYNIIKTNTFAGATYTITAGANSIVNENIFSVPA